MTTAELDRIEYHGDVHVGGNSSATAKWVCNNANVATNRGGLLYAVCAEVLTLSCESIEHEYLNNDASNGKSVLTGHFIPTWKLDALTPDQPFRIRYENASESFTLTGTAWTWASGKDLLNRNIQPLLASGIIRLCLFGTRSSYDAATFDAWADTVSSDGNFLGAGPAQVRFAGSAGDPRQLDNGTLVYDVRVMLEARKHSWNEFYNEDTGEWEALYKRGTTDPMYADAAYAGLLEAP
jgi:hypothetical protein